MYEFPIFGLHHFLEITIFHIRFTNITYNGAKMDREVRRSSLGLCEVTKLTAVLKLFRIL